MLVPTEPLKGSCPTSIVYEIGSGGPQSFNDLRSPTVTVSFICPQIP